MFAFTGKHNVLITGLSAAALLPVTESPIGSAIEDNSIVQAFSVYSHRVLLSRATW